MQLFQHLQALITETDCAVIPGFGAFLASYAPAEILRQENKIFPPAKKLAFNRQLQNSDGSLALLLSRQENIPYQEAVRLLESWGRHCDQLLLSQGSLEFPEIGTVHYDHSKESFRFEKSDTQQLLPSSFLLPVLEIYPVEKPASGLRRLDKTKSSRPVIRPKVKFRSRVIRQQKVLMAFLFVIMLSIFSFMGLKQWNVQEAGLTALFDSLNHPALSSQENKAPNLPVRRPNAKSKESAESPAVSAPAISVNPEAANTLGQNTIYPVSDKESPSFAHTSGYFVVVGAFAVQENALKLSKKLQDEFPDRSVLSRKNNRKLEVVSIYGGATQSEAEAFLHERASGFPGAWISKYN